MSDTPQKKWRYPAQPERYRENPAFEDYEKILGHSELNFSPEDFLRVTAGAVKSPEERAQADAAWEKLSMAEKLKGPPPAYLSTPGLRAEEVALCNPELARACSESGKKGSGIGVPGSGKAAAEQDRDVAPQVSSPEPGTPNPEPRPRRRTPRCTKKVHKERLEIVAQWLQLSASNEDIYRACKLEFGVGRRMAQLYIKEVKAGWANAAGKEDFLADQWRSKLQLDRLIHKGFKDLDAIEDPTKSATMLRTLDRLIKHRDETMEEIRHHRAVTKRDQSPDSKAAKMLRGEILRMPYAELAERLENLRNLWFHEWNLCRLLEKQREGTLGPGFIESPYVAAVQDPKVKMQPTLGPPGSEWCI
jgi:hypothetical protein